MTIHARHYATGRPIAVRIEDGRIAAIQKSEQNPTDWIAPAFFDPQINGCLGISFNSPTLETDQVRTVAETCRKHGIGAFLPTLITNSFEAIHHGFSTLERARASNSDLRQSDSRLSPRRAIPLGRRRPARRTPQAVHSRTGLG